MDEVQKFRVEDLEEILSTLSNVSTSPEKILENLKKLLMFSAENGDTVSEMLNYGAVKVLSDLFSVSKSKVIKAKIGSILFLLSFGNEKSDENELLGIVSSILAHIGKTSDLNVFLQSVSGIRVIISNSSSTSATVRLLPVSTCALLLEHITTALSISIPSLKDQGKQEVLEALVEFVETGAMNEAVRFAVWSTSGGGGGSGGGGSSVGSTRRGSDSEGSSTESLSSIRFLSAFEAFRQSLKGLWEGKRKSGLSALAKIIYEDIESGHFFTTPVILKPTSSNVPLKFLANPYLSGVLSISGGKHTWMKNSWMTLALDEEITGGIYKIVIECNGNLTTQWSIGFGVSNKLLITSRFNSYVYAQPGPSLAMFCNGIYIGQSQVYSGHLFSGNHVVMALEINANAHTVHFFVDGKQIPHCVNNVPSSVLIYVSDCYQNNIVDFKSFERLSSPTVNTTLQCTQYQYQ